MDCLSRVRMGVVRWSNDKKRYSNKLIECSQTVQTAAQGNKLNVIIHPYE
jgi:hypothetical protein